MIYDTKQAIDFTKQYIVPFINSKDKKECLELFAPMAFYGMNTFYRSEDKKVPRMNKELALDEINEFVICEPDDIEALYNLLFDMIHVALEPDYYKNNFDDPKDDFFKQNELEIAICESLNVQNQSVFAKWRGKGSNTVMETFLAKDPITQTRFITVGIISFLFNSNDTYKIYDGPGYQYFAICPHCNKLFYKKRKDQSYCSEKCRNIAGVIRYAKKN